MSESTPNNDDLHGSLNDAVTDRLLAEAIGGESPPDLRDAILASAAADKVTLTPEPKMQANQYRFGIMSLAACLLVCASLAALMLPKSKYQEAAVRIIPAKESAISSSYEGEKTTTEKASRERQRPEIEKPKEEWAMQQSIPLSEPSVVIPSGVSKKLLSKNTSGPIAFDGDGQLLQKESESQLINDAILDPAVAARDELSVSGRQKKKESIFRSAGAPRAATAKVDASGWESFHSIDAGIRAEVKSKGGRSGGRARRSALLPGVLPGHLIEETRGDQYAPLNENKFITARGGDAVSTFSIDVDTASYANVRQFLTQSHQLPPANAVRIEELVNYFNYDYTPPAANSKTPFAAAMEVAACPWAPQHRLVRIGIKGREIKTENRPLSNLVFLVDVSGSMSQPNKLPLLVNGLKRLTRQLGENDRVAIVVYASSEGLALPSTPGSERSTILAALDRLAAGGSTAGGAGIQLAYKVARENFIKGGVNRVLLCTDGDFNVGLSDRNGLGNLVERKAKETGVFLSVLGFGRGNLNDAMMETISNRGNGNYAYIDNDREAHRVLVTQMSGTLITIAKDVKIQVEFNPAHVASYRLIGYENRMLRTEDFNNDAKDAGEIGAGHTVTALYEIVPKGVALPAGADPLKYQTVDTEEPAVEADETIISDSKEMLTLKIRYKQPDGDVSTKLEFPLIDENQGIESATGDFKFATAVASFGMLLRNSEHAGESTFATVLELAEAGIGTDKQGDRSEFIGLIRQAQTLRGE